MGIENATEPRVDGNRRESSSTNREAHSPTPERNPPTQGERIDSGAIADAVEVALAKALETATAEKRWDVVAQMGRELEARRVAREAPNVVAIERKARR
jgi:hypothetical protein